MRVAIIHDWLETYAGAERVLGQILLLYPEADLFCLVDFLPVHKRVFLHGRVPKPTWIQHLPLARKFFRHYLPLFPLAMESHDLRGYDLIISSSHCVAKGVKTQPGQVHICYCHTPVRYAWDLREEYLTQTGNGRGLKGILLRFFLNRLKDWDKRTSSRVTHFVANSRFVAQRIKDFYGREATVIYPPVAVEDFPLHAGKRGDYYFAGSRQVPYKKIHLIAEAFRRMPEHRLKIVGNGPEHARIVHAAGNAANIELVPEAEFAFLREIMSKAKAMVFMAKEDFGIMPVEALACGTPVIAYGSGGVCESVTGLEHPAPCGVFFEPDTVDGLVRAVNRFEEKHAQISAQNCRSQAKKFATEVFTRNFGAFVEAKIQKKP